MAVRPVLGGSLPIGLLVDMRFLDRIDAARVARKLERQSGKTSPQFTLFYTNRCDGL